MIEKDYLLNLKKVIQERSGFDISQYKDGYIERRVNTRLNLTRTSDMKEYISLLKNDRDELRYLMDSLTINVTEFFRNMETFDGLEKEIIPQILKQKENDTRNIIKVWSAGCSSGEETYSLAILFLEALRKSGRDYQLMIQGTDIDKKSLLKAKIGSYESGKVEGIRNELLDRYFEHFGTEYKIKPVIKKYTKFSNLDLTTDFDKNPTTYDLIVCRNVVIYFKEDVKKSLFIKFYNMMRKDGYLILGKNESITGQAMKYLESVNLSERIYKKSRSETRIKL